jgi:3-phytase
LTKLAKIFVLGCLLAALITVPVVRAQVPSVPALLETVPTPGGDGNGIAIWVHPTDPALSTLIATDQDSGILVYDLNGTAIQAIKMKDYKNIDLRYNFPLADLPRTLVVSGDSSNGDIAIFTVNPDTRQLENVTARPIKVGVKGANGLCLYRSATTNLYYFFAVSEDGDMEQWQLFEADGQPGKVDAKRVREFSIGSEAEGCTADDDLGALYVSEEDVAIWRYGANPEDGNRRRVVDTVGGNITEQVEGLTLILGEGESGYLVAANEVGNNYLIYERGGNNKFLGAFAIAAGGTPEAPIDAVQEPNGIDGVAFPLGAAFPEGLFATSDDQNTDPARRSNFKVASWGAIAAALNLPPLIGRDPRVLAIPATTTARVAPTGQTDSVPGGRDAADDPAIWIHPTDPAQSLIIGSDKQGGIVVYDLSGKQLQYLPDGDMNNVDLRYNFPLGGQKVAIVGATNRTTNTLTLYTVDPATRSLARADARPIESGSVEVYGFCMYHSAKSGKYYAFVNSTKTGDVEQFELFDDGAGKIDAKIVRTFRVGTQTEGCVADDELGHLYIGEEGVGVWKYGAEPDAGDQRRAVDQVKPNGKYLTVDVEGMALYYGPNGTGYLIVSSQGSSEFVIYAREGDNAYVGTFTVIEGNGIDAVSGTDGLDVTNFALGTAYPEGVFVAQDDRRINPAGNQNYKLVRWGDIARAFTPPLLIDTSFDPRTVGR